MRACPTCQLSYPADTYVCPKDGTPLHDPGIWVEGNVIRAKYRILQCIGVGGMATVYKAEHIHFHEVLALKVINPGMVHDDALVERFLREAVVTRRLQHPNAISVKDIDRAEDGSPFMVMEFLAGQTLHELLYYEGPLAYSRVCTIAGQVASALHAAHEIGIIHRDVKPANITILSTPQGDTAKVLDFGIAKLKEANIDRAFENDFTLSVAGMVVGTPAYVSPEQAQGKRGSELDTRSDVYSFAVVVYQMLTNHLPVNAETEEQFVIAHARIAPDPITKYIPDLPEPVANLLMRCLSKNREDRPRDPRELTNEMYTWQKLDEDPARKPAAVGVASAQAARPVVADAAPATPPGLVPEIVAVRGPLRPPEPRRDLPKPRGRTAKRLPRVWFIVTVCSGLLFVASFIVWQMNDTESPIAMKPDPPPRRIEIQPTSLSFPSGDMILIPKGVALLGEKNESQELPAFYIDKTEVSTRAYLEFCAQTKHQVPEGVSEKDGELPIRNVNYDDAMAFAVWAHKRLPTALEWEKAARGPDGLSFPWGNSLGSGIARLPVTPDEAKENSQPQAEPSAVDSYPQGASPYGVLNMVGNVWEWVTPGQIRGGGYKTFPPPSPIAEPQQMEDRRFRALVYAGETIPPDTIRADVGFRCALTRGE